MGAAREEIEAEMLAASGNAVSADKLEQEVRRIARFMVDGYNLGFVDVGGWDTHVGQGAASGVLSNRLGQLGRALAAYAEAMGPAWRQLLTPAYAEAFWQRRKKAPARQLPLDPRLREDRAVPRALENDPAPWFFPSLADADRAGDAPLLAML